MLGIDDALFGERDVHLHFPAGAIPKDGPSAGITMATAIISLFTGKKVSSKVAMTGEITLKGRVLAIGGLKEKMLGAKRAGDPQDVVPGANRKDVDDIPHEIKRGMEWSTSITWMTCWRTSSPRSRAGEQPVRVRRAPRPPRSRLRPAGGKAKTQASGKPAARGPRPDWQAPRESGAAPAQAMPSIQPQRG